MIDTATKEAVTAAVEEAGAAILAVRAAGFDTARKADASPVTQADLAAEKILLAAVERLFPGVLVISEERASAQGAPDARTAPERFILIDPLDGTKEFVAGRGEFTVNLAFVENGAPVFGVVGVPAEDAIFIGDAASGAQVRRGGEVTSLRTRAWPHDGAPAAVASRSHADEATKALLTALGAETVAAGSSLKFCKLAEGKADIYPRFAPTMAWDTAAGHAVLAAAGGRVLHRDGRTFAYPANPADGWRNPHFLALGDPSDAARRRVLEAL